jgi:hypothetical protein
LVLVAPPQPGVALAKIALLLVFTILGAAVTAGACMAGVLLMLTSLSG